MRNCKYKTKADFKSEFEIDHYEIIRGMFESIGVSSESKNSVHEFFDNYDEHKQDLINICEKKDEIPKDYLDGVRAFSSKRANELLEIAAEEADTTNIKDTDEPLISSWKRA